MCPNARTHMCVYVSNINLMPKQRYDKLRTEDHVAVGVAVGSGAEGGGLRPAVGGDGVALMLFCCCWLLLLCCFGMGRAHDRGADGT